MKAIPRKLLKVAVVVVASAVLLLAIVTLSNLSLTAFERNKYQAPGKLLSVGGGRMHVYTEGAGSKNVVFLSGWGTAGPALDFGPLIKAVAKSFRASAVECFGYGWSDWTDVPRTNSNVVEEVRLALREAGINPPYVLVPHSISGIYALYYANRYPREIEAIIGLDATVPEQSRYWQPDRESTMPAILRVAGMVRLALLFRPQMTEHDLPAYSDADRRMINMMYVWNYGNRAQRNEREQLLLNAKQLMGYTYPTTIPVSMVLSKDSVDTVQNFMPGFDWIKCHEDQMTGNKVGKICVVDGGHYVYWINSERIAAVVEETISGRPEE